MVTMTAIWDRTAEVLRGRGSMLAGIAGLMIFVPSVVTNAVSVYGGRSTAAVVAGGLIGVFASVVMIWGTMAIVAGASDPSVDRDGAIAAAARRIGPAIGIVALLILAVIVLLLPGFGLLGASGVRATGSDGLVAAGDPSPMIAASPGLLVAGGLYFVVVALVVLGVGVRLALLWPVVVNERRGVGSLARSFQLTRGLAWRIVGVGLLYGIVLLVAASAAQLVASVATRLLLGEDGVATARFVGAIAGAAVAAAGAVVSATFVAQLYRAVTGPVVARPLA